MHGMMLTARVALWLIFIVPTCARLIYTGNAAGAAMVAILAGTLVNFVTRAPDE